MKVSELRIFLLGLAMCTTCSRAARDIIVFGDSYSDNGNGFAATVKLALQTNEVGLSTILAVTLLVHAAEFLLYGRSFKRRFLHRDCSP